MRFDDITDGISWRELNKLIPIWSIFEKIVVNWFGQFVIINERLLEANVPFAVSKCVMYEQNIFALVSSSTFYTWKSWN